MLTLLANNLSNLNYKYNPKFRVCGTSVYKLQNYAEQRLFSKNSF